MFGVYAVYTLQHRRFSPLKERKKENRGPQTDPQQGVAQSQNVVTDPVPKKKKKKNLLFFLSCRIN